MNVLKQLALLLDVDKPTLKVMTVTQILSGGKIRLEDKKSSLIIEGNYSLGTRLIVNDGVIAREAKNVSKAFLV